MKPRVSAPILRSGKASSADRLSALLSAGIKPRPYSCQISRNRWRSPSLLQNTCTWYPWRSQRCICAKNSRRWSSATWGSGGRSVIGRKGSRVEKPRSPPTPPLSRTPENEDEDENEDEGEFVGRESCNAKRV